MTATGLRRPPAAPERGRDQPIYIVFGSWVKTRRFAYDQSLELGTDVLHPNDQRASALIDAPSERRVVFVRERDHRISDGTAAYWRRITEAARASNDANDFITEILEV